MTKEEIVRRVAALIALPPAERPVSVYLLAQLASLAPKQLRDIVRQSDMHERTRKRLERALLWVENNQVTQTKHIGADGSGSRPATITIGQPRPPQVTVNVVRFTASGPRMRSLALNPLAFETPQTKLKEDRNGQSTPADKGLPRALATGNRRDERNQGEGRGARRAGGEAAGDAAHARGRTR